MESNTGYWGDIKPVYTDGHPWSFYGIDSPAELGCGEYHSAGWFPGIPDDIISDYSNRGEMVLDQFVGGGTTLMEAVLLHRRAIGCDINDAATHLSREMVNLTLEAEGIYIRKRDARRLKGISDSSIDLICTQPPYLDGVKYSTDIKGDMSLMTLEEYMASMKDAARESYRVLKKGRYCVIMIGDIKRQGCIIPLGIGTANAFIRAGFKLKSIIINKRQAMEGWSRSTSCSLLREYLLVFAK